MIWQNKLNMTIDGQVRAILLAKSREENIRRALECAQQNGITVCRRTITKWRREWRIHNRSGPARTRRRKTYSRVPHEHLIHALRVLEMFPLLYEGELSEIIFQQTNYRYTNDQISRALDFEGFSRKKLDFRAKEQSIPLRILFRSAVSQFSANQLVFADETHAKPEDVRRKYGYAIDAKPAFMRIRNMAHGDSEPISALCAMSLDGIFAVRTVDKNVDTDLFIQTLEATFLPRMNPYPQPRSVLVLDNAPVHDMPRIVKACSEHNVVVLPLPAYSYDFNPIELAFHQAKESVRKIYGIVSGEIDQKLIEGLNSVHRENAIHFFQHCGYEVGDFDLVALDIQQVI